MYAFIDSLTFFYHRIFNILFLLCFAATSVHAKVSVCKFTQIRNEIKNQTYISCDLKDVKFNNQSRLDVKIDGSTIKTVQNVLNISLKTDEYFVENEIKSLVKQLKFKSSKLTMIPNVIFQEFQKMEFLYASDVDLNDINSLSFNKAENLLEAFLQNNRLKTIKSYVFVHTKKLEVLDLSANRIENIQAFAFIGLNNLKSLDLSNNKLSELDDSTFIPLVNLNAIWLNHNQLTLITSIIFTKVNQKLQKISMSHNNINEISPHLFDNLESLRFLLLNGNNCIDKSFINHVIPENASIKMELKKCHQKYRKVLPKDDEEFNIANVLKRVESATKICNDEFAILKDLQASIEDQMKQLS